MGNKEHGHRLDLLHQRIGRIHRAAEQGKVKSFEKLGDCTHPLIQDHHFATVLKIALPVVTGIGGAWLVHKARQYKAHPAVEDKAVQSVISIFEDPLSVTPKRAKQVGEEFILAEQTQRVKGVESSIGCEFVMNLLRSHKDLPLNQESLRRVKNFWDSINPFSPIALTLDELSGKPKVQEMIEGLDPEYRKLVEEFINKGIKRRATG